MQLHDSTVDYYSSYSGSLFILYLVVHKSQARTKSKFLVVTNSCDQTKPSSTNRTSPWSH